MPGPVFLMGGYGNTLPPVPDPQSSCRNRAQLGKWTMTVSVNFNIHLVFDWGGAGGDPGGRGTAITAKALIRVVQL